MFVLKEFRGKQIFSRLNDHCIQFAKEQGHRAIKLLLYRTNILAKKVYERLGFEKNPYQYFYFYFLESDKEDFQEKMEENYQMLEDSIQEVLPHEEFLTKQHLITLTEIKEMET